MKFVEVKRIKAMYCQHINSINNLQISKNLKYLLSSSKSDNCIMVWRIHSTKIGLQ